MKKDVYILMLEDNPLDAELAELVLRNSGLNFSFTRVESKSGYVHALAGKPPTLILSDYSLPDFNGNDALEIAQETCPDTPFIFVTGTLGEEVAIETLKNGATDYVLKTRLSRLVPSVNRALREAAEREEHRRAERQLRESHRQLRQLSIYLQSVREAERTRIAREVHDELGQALTGCKIDLAWIANRLPKGGGALLERARGLAARIDSTIETVRRISAELRPGVLDHLGLAAALEWQASEFQNRTGIPCEVRSDLHEARLDQNLSTTLFRIFQETLTNVIRHAEATRVRVTLARRDDAIVLEVTDNGRGISPTEIESGHCMGLLGMRERAALLGGAFEIDRVSRGHGTRVCVSIPAGRHHPQPHTDHENPAGGRSRHSAARLEANIGR